MCHKETLVEQVLCSVTKLWNSKKIAQLFFNYILLALFKNKTIILVCKWQIIAVCIKRRHFMADVVKSAKAPKAPKTSKEAK